MISFFSFSVSLYSRPSYMVFSRRSSNLTLFIISWTSVPSTVYLHNFGSAGDTAGGRPQRAETPCCRPCAILYAAAARAVPPPRAQPLACEPGMARRAQGTPARSVSRCKAPQWSGGSRAHRERPRQSAQCRYRAGPATEGGGRGMCEILTHYPTLHHEPAKGAQMGGNATVRAESATAHLLDPCDDLLQQLGLR
eukprot:scaffold24279_cov112-Isochrysis_galbana.AAC.3